MGREFTLRIFDGGRTRSKIEVQDAIQEQALIAYEGALLEALEDVENAMRDFAEASHQSDDRRRDLHLHRQSHCCAIFPGILGRSSA